MRPDPANPAKATLFERVVVALLWSAMAMDLWHAWQMSRWNRRVKRADLRWLRDATEGEGRRLAEMVRRGEASRADLERALAETGDGEPAFALKLLDQWGIK